VLRVWTTANSHFRTSGCSFDPDFVGLGQAVAIDKAGVGVARDSTKVRLHLIEWLDSQSMSQEPRRLMWRSFLEREYGVIVDAMCLPQASIFRGATHCTLHIVVSRPLFVLAWFVCRRALAAHFCPLLWNKIKWDGMKCLPINRDAWPWNEWAPSGTLLSG